MSDPTREHPSYPVGAKYQISDGSECEVVEHGFLSVKLKGTTLSGWVGTNEINDWLRTGKFVLIESDRDVEKA